MPRLRETVVRPRPRNLRERAKLSAVKGRNLAGLLLMFIGVLWALGAVYKMMEVHREVGRDSRWFLMAALPIVFFGFVLVFLRVLRRGIED